MKITKKLLLILSSLSCLGLASCSGWHTPFASLDETSVEPATEGLEFVLSMDTGTYKVGVGKARDQSKIVIPSSYLGVAVTAVADNGFKYCSMLASITIPDSVKSIGSAAFDKCSSLTSISIPSSVTSIGDYAFSGCSSITSISIPDSVTSIGWGSFSGCSYLSDVYFGGSMEQWDEIFIDSDNDPLIFAAIHYNWTPEE